MSKKEELAVATPEFNILTPIDFNVLDEAIKKIGESKSVLTKEEKEFAVNVIGEWERNVIDKLENRKNEIIRILRAIELKPETYRSEHVYTIDDEDMEKIVINAGVEAEYKKYLENVNTVMKLRFNEPEEPDSTDLSLTAYQIMEMKSEYQLDKAKHRMLLTKARNNQTKSLLLLKEAIRDSANGEALLKHLNKSLKGISKLMRSCEDKSQLAKINITIESSEIRSYLQTLLNFSSGIK